MSKNKRKLKGIGGLFSLGFVLLLAIVLIIGVSLLMENLKFQLALKLTVDIQADDTGTWTTTFLKTDKGGSTYMQTLGSLTAENYLDFIGPDIELVQATLNNLRKIERFNRSISVPGKLKIGNSDQSGDRYLVDIPVPGGGKTQIEIR